MKDNDAVTYMMETVYDELGLVHHWNWQIGTNAAVIRNRNPIIQSKNTCYNSLSLHLRKFCGIKIDRMKVKHKEVRSGKETTSAN